MDSAAYFNWTGHATENIQEGAPYIYENEHFALIKQYFLHLSTDLFLQAAILLLGSCTN